MNAFKATHIFSAITRPFHFRLQSRECRTFMVSTLVHSNTSFPDPSSSPTFTVPSSLAAGATIVTTATADTLGSSSDFAPLPVTELNLLRTDPLLVHLTNVIMRHGEKSKAQRIIASALSDIRLRTNTDPYVALRDAITALTPLLRLVSGKKGSKVIRVPVPMTERQQRRKAINWLLDGAKIRPEKTFEKRLSGEVLAVLSGTASGLTKKATLHKEALANRQNALGVGGALPGQQMISVQQPTTGQMGRKVF